MAHNALDVRERRWLVTSDRDAVTGGGQAWRGRSARGHRLVGEHAHERANRLGLLTLHGMIGVWAGTLVLFTGTAPAYADLWDGLRLLTGAWALVAGIVVMVGLATHRVRLLAAGLLGLAAWMLAMAVGYAVTVVDAGAVRVTWPWDGAGTVAADAAAGSGLLYPLALYVGLFGLLGIHLWTLRLVDLGRGRPGRP